MRKVYLSIVTLLPVLMANTAFAQTTESSNKGLIALAAGLGIALAAFGGAMAQGKIGAAALEGIARNPSAQNKIFTPMILGLAFAESLVIFTLLIAFILSGKI
jgi:F-type H+-transporting ATPase subunit c